MAILRQKIIDPRERYLMCQVCGCTPCKKCGAPIEGGVCSGCGKKAADCSCK